MLVTARPSARMPVCSTWATKPMRGAPRGSGAVAVISCLLRRATAGARAGTRGAPPSQPPPGTARPAGTTLPLLPSPAPPDAHHLPHPSRATGPDGTIDTMTPLDTAPQALGPAADPVCDSTSVTGTGATPRTLTIGPHTNDTPAPPAPLAGLPNAAIPSHLREFGALHSEDDGGLFVGEMVTTRALVEGHRE